MAAVTGQLEHRCFVQLGAGGLVDARWCTGWFVEVLCGLPADLAEAEVTRPELLLHDDGRLAVYFTPFDWVNPSARVLIVGLTPGRQQLCLAVNTTAAALRAGCGVDEPLRRADARQHCARPQACRRNDPSNFLLWQRPTPNCTSARPPSACRS